MGWPSDVAKFKATELDARGLVYYDLKKLDGDRIPPHFFVWGQRPDDTDRNIRVFEPLLRPVAKEFLETQVTLAACTGLAITGIIAVRVYVQVSMTVSGLIGSFGI